MENTFVSARFEGIRKNKYLLKHLKNRNARNFLFLYTNCNEEITDELKEVVCLYNRLNRGSLDSYIPDAQIQKTSKTEIEEVYLNIKERATSNFIYFYQSYLRKIEKGYEQEYVQDALGDLKNAYYIYRKANNPLLDLQNYQITEDEMRNLYNILVPNKNESSSNKKVLEEK